MNNWIRSHKKAGILVLAGVVVFVAVLVIITTGGKSNQPSFQEIHDQYCPKETTIYWDVDEENKWMRIDSNPLDFDSISHDEVYQYIIDANDALGVPYETTTEMMNVRERDGVHCERFGDVYITWYRTYGQGLEVIYELAED